MPLRAQGLDNHIRNRLATALTLRTEAIRMTPDTPGEAFLLDKRGARIERIATLGAEKVTRVPLGATRHDDLALDGGLAALAARGEALVEVEVAVEPRRGIGAVLFLEPAHHFFALPAGEDGEVETALACDDALTPRGVFEGGFGVEGYAFELFAALVAGETGGVEAAPCGADDAA